MVSAVRNKRLGEYLIERGWVTAEQLQRALQTHKVLGGRLGTCLLEMDALPEDLLLKALSEISGIPAVGVDELRQAQPEAYKLLTGRVAKRCQAIPFRVSGNQTSIAMLDIHNLQLQDELGFVTGRRVKVFLANEARIYEALERFYGEECPPRFVHLLERLNRSRYLWERMTAAPAVESAGEARAAAPPPAAPPAPLESADTPVAPAMAVAAPEPVAAAVEPPAPAPARSYSIPVEPEELRKLSGAIPTRSLEEVQAQLLNPADPDDVGAALLGFLCGHYRRVALLRVVRGELRGWMGCGELDRETLRGFSGRFDEPSLFVGLNQGAPFVRGPLAPFPLHRRLAGAWNGELPGDCLLLPVRVKERLVTVIYLDRGASTLSGVDLEPLQRLAAKAAIAFELCIMRSKLKKA
jgi:hypothetical protein